MFFLKFNSCFCLALFTISGEFHSLSPLKNLFAFRCPQLETLSLNRTGTASAMLHCPRLVSLDVSSCHKLSDAGVRAAATACPLLASLDMSYCAYVSDETLREISLACNLLRSLDASHCPNISLEVSLLGSTLGWITVTK